MTRAAEDRGVLLGIFVGGASRRMGSRPKGLLPTGGTSEPIVARTLRLAREIGLDAVLVGNAAAYAAIAPGIEALDDDPPGVGPLGGLAALLARAGSRAAIAVACDMPFVTAEVLLRLARGPWRGEVVAHRVDASAPFEPLLARYDSARVLPVLRDAIAHDVRSFQALFAKLEIEPLAIGADESHVIRDWDTPEDVS
jgi:molybdopterin-guanine dinucleotide biosynthesis protein A